MSIIAQARLTSLSQKSCLSMVARRHDIRKATLHSYTTLNNNNIINNSHRVELRSDEPITLIAKVISCIISSQGTTSPNCRYTVEFNTPKLLFKLNTNSNWALTNTRPLQQQQLTSSNITSRVASIPPDWRLPFTIAYTSYNTNRYGDHEKQEHSDHARGFTKHKKRRKFNDSDSSGSNGGSNGGGSRMMPLLGLVGFFKGLTTGDIEDEREKLSDEQKVKKMKPMELLIAKGVLSMCDQNYGKANELFHEALHLAQVEKDEEQEMMILNLLASNYFESGNMDKAETLFIELIKRMILHGLESTDLAILELSLKLASIYSKNQLTHDKATQGFKFVINSLLNDLEDLLSSVDEIDIHEISDERKDELALLGWGYDWFAKHLLTMNDFRGAAEMLQRALQISSKVLGPLHDQTLILLNDVGTTMAMNEAPGEGRTFIRKAVEGAIESQSKELPSFYVNLGLVNLKLKKLHEAKRYCEYSLELASKNREHHNSYEVIQLSRNCLSEVERLLEAENHQ